MILSSSMFDGAGPDDAARPLACRGAQCGAPSWALPCDDTVLRAATRLAQLPCYPAVTLMESEAERSGLNMSLQLLLVEVFSLFLTHGTKISTSLLLVALPFCSTTVRSGLFTDMKTHLSRSQQCYQRITANKVVPLSELQTRLTLCNLFTLKAPR